MTTVEIFAKLRFGINSGFLFVNKCEMCLRSHQTLIQMNDQHFDFWEMAGFSAPKEHAAMMLIRSFITRIPQNFINSTGEG